MGKHTDAEKELVPEAPIVSISLGATRDFHIHPVGGGALVRSLPMPGGSYLVMGGAMQREFKHSVPKISGSKAASIGRRVNITFRQFKAAAFEQGSTRLFG